MGSYDLYSYFHRFLYLQHPEYFGHRYPITLIVKADKGDKATVVLPDGTDVILNSASQLSYLRDFGKTNAGCNWTVKATLK